MKRFYLLPIVCCALSISLSAQENNGTATTSGADDNRILSADSLITTDARLDSLYQTLPEVMITGERPIVKAAQGKLVYDLPRLIQNLPVDNAYDAVKELPGVIEMNGGLQLAGQGVTVILDGKVTTLSTEQLYSLLRSIPASRIEKAEVMYNAPARYQVRGALINITLKQSVGGPGSWQGELYAKYRQKHNEGFEERASLLFSKNKFSADFLYSHSHGRGYSTTDKEAVHTLADGSVHPMTTYEVGRGRSHTHNFRVGADYNIAKDHQLSFVYNGGYSTSHNWKGVTGTQVSTTHGNSTDWLHNGRLDYRTPFGLKAGAELTWNIYAGSSKSFGDKLALDASLAVEHYKTPVWNQWDWYPIVNLNYMPSPGHILQLSLSSDKDYPDYWAVQDAVSYIGGGYSELHGNPLLKPAQEYELKMTYILKSKYIFSAWFNHTKDYSVQTLYQSSERLVEIYKTLNFDYQQQAGIQASIPFKVKDWLNSRLTLIGLWHREKDGDFWDIPFDRKQCYGIAQMNNTFTLSTKPDLKLTVTGFVHSKAIQGIYDLPTSGNVNIALRYGFAKNKAILNLYCNDIFETGQISPRIRFKTQNVTNHYSCFREFGVSFTYKFGGYKEKQREAVDTSRFK